jgi:hypothetical protein
MKKILVTCCAAALLFACNNKKADEKGSDAKTADNTEMKAEAKKDDKATENMPPMSDSAMMKAWMDYATPGAMHTWLAKTNGTWEAEVSQWGGKPGEPPTKAKATNVQTSALGGRYVIGKFTTTMMGMPMEGMSTMGYDNVKKMFVSTWIDNMGSGIAHMSGTYDEATKTMNMKGKQTDPIMKSESDLREEMKIIDDNTYFMAMYGTGPDGKEMKFMEGTFKRKK